jgi:hypothetical protein
MKTALKILHSNLGFEAFYEGVFRRWLFWDHTVKNGKENRSCAILRRFRGIGAKNGLHGVKNAVFL